MHTDELPLETQLRLAQVRDQVRQMPREVLEDQFLLACEALIWREVINRKVAAQLKNLQEALEDAAE